MFSKNLVLVFVLLQSQHLLAMDALEGSKDLPLQPARKQTTFIANVPHPRGKWAEEITSGNYSDTSAPWVLRTSDTQELAREAINYTQQLRRFAIQQAKDFAALRAQVASLQAEKKKLSGASEPDSSDTTDVN